MSDRPPAILSEVDVRGVATLTLNRPDRGNAYDEGMLDALNDTLDTLAADAAVRVLVIRGAGRHFQAGADIDWLSQAGLLDTQGAFAVANAIGQTVARLNEFPRPSMAVVHGACYAGGCSLARCADVVVATPGAVFGLTEVRAGAAAPPISPHIVSAIGGVNARRLALTGERFGAEEARRIGLVNEVVEAAHLEVRLAGMVEVLRSMPSGLADADRAVVLTPDERRIARLAQESWVLRNARREGGGPHIRERRRPGRFLSPGPKTD